MLQEWVQARLLPAGTLVCMKNGHSILIDENAKLRTNRHTKVIIMILTINLAQTAINKIASPSHHTHAGTDRLASIA